MTSGGGARELTLSVPRIGINSLLIYQNADILGKIESKDMSMLNKFFLAGACAASIFAAAPAQATTIVNLNGVTNASLDGSNAVNVNLGAGTYNLSFVTGLYTAFNRFSSANGCDGTGANCITGFENSARIFVNGGTLLFGDGAASGGLGPQATGGYYSTAAQSFAASSVFSSSFVLAAPATVSFYLYDDILGDNSGGVSLAVSAVPEPATWLMMVLGLGVIGFGMRRRADRSAALA